MNKSTETTPTENVLLLATEVPYWRQQTGAQQRILGLVQFFRSRGWQVTSAYIGSLKASENPGSQTSLDCDRIAALQLDVISLIDDWRPQGWIESVAWQLKCIGNAIASQLPTSPESAKDAFAPSSSNPKRLCDFADAELARRFGNLVRLYHPAVVIVEYVTLAYLVPHHQRQAATRYWVDTHDLLSSRCAQSAQKGLAHWIQISEAEEAAALQTFDGIIAIEDSEARQFQRMTHHRLPVIVAGYSSARLHSPVPSDQPGRRSSSDPINIGLIASNNPINAAGLDWFLQAVWPELKQVHASSCHSINLIVAGSICDNEFLQSENSDLVIRLGILDCLEAFYDRIDIAINPVQLGTGLKIKNVEALCFGKPLIANRVSLAGLIEAEQGSPWIAVDSATEMAAALSDLAKDPVRLASLSAAAQAYSRKFLTPEAVYGELATRFESARLTGELDQTGRSSDNRA